MEEARQHLGATLIAIKLCHLRSTNLLPQVETQPMSYPKPTPNLCLTSNQLLRAQPHWILRFLARMELQLLPISWCASMLTVTITLKTPPWVVIVTHYPSRVQSIHQAIRCTSCRWNLITQSAILSFVSVAFLTSSLITRCQSERNILAPFSLRWTLIRLVDKRQIRRILLLSPLLWDKASSIVLTRELTVLVSIQEAFKEAQELSDNMLMV